MAVFGQRRHICIEVIPKCDSIRTDMLFTGIHGSYSTRTTGQTHKDHVYRCASFIPGDLQMIVIIPAWFFAVLGCGRDGASAPGSLFLTSSMSFSISALFCVKYKNYEISLNIY